MRSDPVKRVTFRPPVVSVAEAVLGRCFRRRSVKRSGGESPQLGLKQTLFPVAKRHGNAASRCDPAATFAPESRATTAEEKGGSEREERDIADPGWMVLVGHEEKC